MGAITFASVVNKVHFGVSFSLHNAPSHCKFWLSSRNKGWKFYTRHLFLGCGSLSVRDKKGS